MQDPARRVLYVTYNDAPKLGGLEQVVQRARDAMCERAEVLTLAQGAQGYEERDPSILRPKREGLLPYMAFLYGRGMLQGARGDFDVVVTGSALTALPTLHLAKRYGARSATIIHGLDTIYASRLYQRIYRHAMSRMDRVIANSRATRDEAVRRGVDREKIIIIPPGCDASAFLEPRETESLRVRWGLQGSKVILSAGRVVRRKGIDCFIRKCLPAVVRTVPETKLLVAGGNPKGALAHTDDEVARVHRAIEESGMAKHVMMTGHLSFDELVAVFQLADVFVLPVIPVMGDMEGFGIVLLEAGAAGKPVVATAIGGITDAVVDQDTGILVPPNEYGAMAEALIALLTDDALCETYGQRSRNRVLQDFSRSAIAARYADALLGA